METTCPKCGGNCKTTDRYCIHCSFEVNPNAVPPVHKAKPITYSPKPIDEKYRTSCNSCGKDVDTRWNYCTRCGSRLGAL